MKRFKEILLIIAVIAILGAMSLPAGAHTWDADEWATDQMTLTADMMTCVEYIQESTELFYKECADKDLLGRTKGSIYILTKNTRHHSPAETMETFAAADFKDIPKGTEAIVSTKVTLSGMKYILTILFEQKLREATPPVYQDENRKFMI